MACTKLLNILNMKNNKKKSVVILGAGLAGLAAGYELVKAGHNVTIIEQENEVGGLARTFVKNGFKFDTGPHRWYTKSDMVNTWMLKLLGDEVIKVPRLTRIYFDNHFFEYPIKIKSTLVGMGITRTFLAVIDYLIVSIWSKFDKKEPLTLEDGYIKKFGNTLYKMFFKRYSEKLWGTSNRNISADWIGQRTRGFNIGTVIYEAIFKSKKVVSFVDEFSYPKNGIGRIAEKLAEEILDEGGKIILKAHVDKIISNKSKITQVEYTQKKNVKKIAVDEIVSSIPLSEVITSLTPKVSNQILEVNKKLTYRDELQVALFVNKTHLTPDTWVYVHSLDVPFIRYMEMDNWAPNMSPKGTTTLVFEVACNEGDEMWNKSDAEITSFVTNSFIKEFKSITKDNIIGSFVHRMPKEYPVYHVGYRQDVEALKRYLLQYANLQLVGRNGTFRYNNMDHSIEMGLYAAWNIIEGERKFDIDSVNIEREYLEQKDINGKAIELSEDQHVEEKH